MAIQKTTFSLYTTAELLDYLQNNAMDYFDEIELNSTTDFIDCKIGDNVVFSLISPGYASGTTAGAHLQMTPIGANSTTDRCFKGYTNDMSSIFTAYKTSKGIMLSCQSAYNIVICKNENGDTCLVTTTWAYPTSTSSDRPVEVWDFNNNLVSYRICKDSGNNSTMTNPFKFGVRNAAISMFPVIGNDGVLMDGVFVSYLSPYAEEALKGGLEIVVNSDHYAYSGVIALKD